ncbi:MAG TPA: hypothetical protein VKD43_14330 [Xanthobacteraceae bacterium]|nr:hypothetical protein [Xanthobacteraceae bacterium]
MFAALRYGVVALTMMVMAGLAPCQAQTTGRVHIVAGKAGFIVGVGGGSGTLTFNGRTYPLSVGGVSFGAQIGVSRTEFVGRALNMQQASDIAGTYTALGAGVALAGGGSAVRLQNAKGVILELQGRKVGVEVAAALSGVQIALR